MPKPTCSICGQKRVGQAHHPRTGDHEYAPPKREGGFGQQRQALKPRSAKTERYYEEVRRPAVAQAVGNGRKPCQIQSPACTGYVQGIHESATRGRFGGLQSAVEAGPTFDCCHACNHYVSLNPVWAKEKGYLLSNRGETRREPRQRPPAASPPPTATPNVEAAPPAVERPPSVRPWSRFG